MHGSLSPTGFLAVNGAGWASRHGWKLAASLTSMRVAAENRAPFEAIAAHVQPRHR